MHDHGFSIGDLRDVIDDRDAPTTRTRRWFHDPVVHLSFLIFEVAEHLQEGDVFFWQDESERHHVEDSVGAARKLLRPLNVPLQEILARNILRSDEVVCLLPDKHARHVLLQLRPEPH